MKTKHLLLASVMLLLTAFAAIAQNAADKKFSVPDIPFGKKLPPPDLTQYPGIALPHMMPPDMKTILMPGKNRPDINAIKKQLEAYRQQMQNQGNGETMPFQGSDNNAKVRHGNSNSSDFYLTKDINALAESYPNNYPDLFSYAPYQPPGNTYYPTASFAVLNDVAYFAADDGIHGNELWRSDGTAAGTYMLKDVEPGTATSYLYAITASNGKVYFAAYTSADGYATWVSDGTESGTQVLNQVYNVTTFFSMGKKTYFIADGSDFWSALWQTDGTPSGTTLVTDLSNEGIGLGITQPTVVNHTFFFTLLNYTSGLWELWGTDGTDAGTHHLATNASFADLPLQLTKYNNKLYFSSDDGTGRKLWVSDGTDAGTLPVPGNHDILIDVSYSPTSVLGYNIQPFPILNHVLYMAAGFASQKGDGLYKYDASNNEGVILVKDLVPNGDTASIESLEMQVANHKLYFKVTSNTGGVHDELWSSEGTKASTQPAYKLLPEETIHNLYSGDGNLYFVKYGKFFGTELWKIFNAPSGSFPFIVSDIFKGATSSFPTNLTAFKSHLIFSAANGEKGTELFMTNSFGAAIVKDIKTINTISSNAGWNSAGYTGYIGMAALGNTLLFNAYERVHGYELYKSDGSAAGTKLLNDILPGETGFSLFYQFVSKNNAVYFSAVAGTTSSNYFIYKTNGTRGGLSKIASDSFLIQSFSIADNRLVFYTHYNVNTSLYELWRSDGTAAGTKLLSSSVYSSDYLNVVGNTAFFVAGDAVNGYELWKSDGSVSGTKLVKDINPGTGGSFPKGMFIYKNEVYFAADDKGIGSNSFWKSDGTKAGTVKLRDIDPWYSSTSAYSTARYYFEVSNNILYFSAINYNDTKGTQLWRTDGTVKGTWSVKDISPTANSNNPVPIYFTDVNGTLFFIGDDGISGAELWKTDGTEEGTVLVKDITPGAGRSFLSSLVSFAGKLYFTNSSILWSSDGTADGTVAVDDAGISSVNVYNIVTANDKLFLSGYTLQYGTELYVGKGNNEGKFIASKITNEDAIKTNLSFNAAIYPNPVVSNATLQITGNTKNVSISITDMSGKKVWQSSNSNATPIKLPTEKYTAGTYIVTVTNGTESKTIKLIKQ